MKAGKTERGFARIDFRDEYGHACSLQKSSLASQHAIWFGPNQPEPVFLVPGEGWKPYPLPESVQCHTRMHLTQEQVKELLPYLQRFVETGELY